jgi:hypothetical protein
MERVLNFDRGRARLHLGGAPPFFGDSRRRRRAHPI